MPYPIDLATNKHDLLVMKKTDNQIKSEQHDNNIMKDLDYYSDTISMLRGIRDYQPNETLLRKRSYLYTYHDSPKPPLSRQFVIIGYTDVSLSSIRQLLLLLDDDNNNNGIVKVAECLETCTIAVKRIEDPHSSPSDLQLTKEFILFMKCLNENQYVAIVAPDKYHRFSILCPSSIHINNNDNDNNNDNINYSYAYCHVGYNDKVQEYLRKIKNNQHNNTDENHNDDNVNHNNKRIKLEDNIINNYKRIKVEGSNQETKEEEEQLWKPPADDENDTPWKPPGYDDDDNNNNDYNNDGTSSLWKPPKMDDDDNDQPITSSSWNDDNSNNNNWNDNSNSNNDSLFMTQNQQQSTNSKSSTSTNKSDTNKFHNNIGAQQADEFYSNLTRTLDTRSNSRLYHMRAFNGWVKSTQIHECNPLTNNRNSTTKTKNKNKKDIDNPSNHNNGLCVLDLACGKGGDLNKWLLHPRGIQNYVGVDVARGSLIDAAIRARKVQHKFHNFKCTFTCADLGYDVPGRYKYIKHHNNNNNSDEIIIKNENDNDVNNKNRKQMMQKLLSWSLYDELKKNHMKTPNDPPQFTLKKGGGILINDTFDIISIQFAIHYMMQTKKRAKRFFYTVSQLLQMNGILIATTIDARIIIYHLMELGYNYLNNDTNNEDNNNKNDQENVVVSVGDGACRFQFHPDIVKKIFQRPSTKIKKEDNDDNVDNDDGIDENLFGLEYTFTLVEGSDHASGVGDAVNLPEWLIPIPILIALAKEVGLELVYVQNFHEFYKNRSNPDIYNTYHQTMYNMHVLNVNGTISQPEWDISRLYCAIQFRKVYNIDPDYTLSDDDDNENDDENDSDGDDDDNAEKPITPPSTPPPIPIQIIDPKIKAKLFPMALMKAKKTVGNDAWGILTAEEKNQYTEIELYKML